MIETDMTLKTAPGPFRALWRRQKTGELRKNDRDYQVGDRLELIEHDGQTWLHPFRRIYIEVTHVVVVNKWAPIAGGEEWVMLSFRELGRKMGLTNAKWARCPDCHEKKRSA